MIQIQINNEFLNLGDASIRIERNNPSFLTDVYQGDFSFPFTIPLTESNLRILGYANSIELFDRKVDLIGYLWLFGAPYLKTKIFISSGTNKSITLNLSAGLKALSTGDKNLNEIDYGPDYVLGSDSDGVVLGAKTVSLVTDYNTYGFTFVPHKNESFYGDSNPDFCGVVNRQNSITGDFYQNQVSVGNRFCLVPFLYLFFILKKIFQAEALIPKGNFWDDKEMQKLLVYNNYSLDRPDRTNNTFVKSGSDQNYNTVTRLRLDLGPAGTFDDGLAWQGAADEYEITYVGEHIFDLSLSAYLKRGDDFFGTYNPHFRMVIDGVTAGTVYFGSQTQGYVTRSLSFSYTATPSDIGKKVYFENVIAPVFFPLNNFEFRIITGSYLLVSITQDSLNVYNETISYKNHVPDITVSDFLAQFKNMGIKFDFDYQNGTVSLNYNKGLKNLSTIDWTDKITNDYELNFEDKNKGYKLNYDFGSSDELVDGNFKKYVNANFRGEFDRFENLPFASKEGNIALVLNSNQLFISKQNSTSTGLEWVYFCDNYYDLVYGNGEQEVFSKIAPMFMTLAENEGGSPLENTALMPTIKQTGSSDMFGIGVNSFDLRFVFLRGVNQSNGLTSPKGGKYNYASSTAIGINGNSVGSYEFPILSKKGLNQIFSNDFFSALNNSEFVERDIRLNEVDIINLDTSKKVTISGIGYLIKSVSLSISKKLSLARVKFLKI
jgi:hypothetical protein